MQLKNRLAKPEAGSALDFLIGALLGVLFFLLVYGVSTLNVTYDSWIYCGYIEEDIIQRYAGWLFYRASPRSWPLTVAENLSQPYGMSIVFTDSGPLAAIICKMLSPVLPETFQYFGWYNLLACALQGGFAMLLLRRFGFGRLYSGLGAALFLGMPVFIERLFRHDSLAQQWMVLAALLFYFTARHRERFPAIGFFVLCVLAPGIHTYFLPMIYAILLAALIERALKRRKLLAPLLYLGACFAGTLAMAYAMGILTRGGSGGASGFGSYSMNLNALFNPTSFDWYNRQSENLTWSRILPVLPQNHHQYDGFNYLGFGVLLALAAMALYAIVRNIRALRRKEYEGFHRAAVFLKSHIWLLLVCAALGIFALSNVVVWGETTLFTLPLPNVIERLCAVFRASGRLFWPVSYLLTLAPVVFIGQKLRGHGREVCLFLLLALQLFDISATLKQKHDYFAAAPLVQQDEFTGEGWIFLMENYDNVLCLGNLFDYNLAAGIIRYNPDVQTNLLLANRGDFPVVEASYAPMIESLRNGEPLPQDTLYLCSDEQTMESILAGLHPDARGYQTGHYYAIAIPKPGCPLPELLPAALQPNAS